MCRQREDVFIIPPAEPGPTQKTKSEEFLWQNWCEKILWENRCSQKVSDLLYGSLFDDFLQKSLQSKDKLCFKQVSVKTPEESYSLSQDKEETTRYIAGYIIFSLKNLMEKNRSRQ